MCIVRPIRDTQNKILIVEDKGDPVYYDISSKQKLTQVLLEMLHRDFHAGYFDKDPLEPTLPSISLQQVDALPFGPVKEAAENEWALYNSLRVCYISECENNQNIIMALQQRDGALAWDCLKSLYDSDYGRFSMRVEVLHQGECPAGDLLVAPEGE